MSDYFKNFPSIRYDVFGTKPEQTKLVRNILRNYYIEEKSKQYFSLYYPYIIKDGERPDIVSFNVYGSVRYTWIIFIANEMVDPLWDWPLSTNDLNKYIAKKYGSIAAAQIKVKFYRYKVRDQVLGSIDTPSIPEVNYEVDLETYDSLPIEKRSIYSCYQYEVDENERKRQIRLIRPEYVSTIQSALEAGRNNNG